MAKDSKSPSPPSFYENMSKMPGKGMPPADPGKDAAAAGGSGEATEIVSTLFRVFEKWGKSDPKAAKYIEQMMEPLKNYAMTELKKDPKEFQGSTASPDPSAAGGQGPAPAAGAGAGSAGGGMDAQPVPA